MSYQNYIEKLKQGYDISFRPRGNSMKPRIHSGNLVTISPEIESLHVDDILFCKVKGNYYVHLLTAIKGDRYQISNNHGFVNGWISKNSIFGKVVKIEN